MARIKNKKGGQKSRDTLPLGDDGIRKIQFMLIKIFFIKNTRSPDFTVQYILPAFTWDICCTVLVQCTLIKFLDKNTINNQQINSKFDRLKYLFNIQQLEDKKCISQSLNDGVLSITLLAM